MKQRTRRLMTALHGYRRVSLIGLGDTKRDVARGHWAGRTLPGGSKEHRRVIKKIYFKAGQGWLR